MPTVFTGKNNGFSRFYDTKLTQSYTISQDGLTCPDKNRNQSHRVQWQMLAKQSGKIISQTLASWLFRSKPCKLVNMADELQNTSQFFRRFTIPPDPLDAQIPRPGPDLTCFTASACRMNESPHYGQPLRAAKLLLFRKNIARISTSELIIIESPISRHFWKLSRFVIWIFRVISGLKFPSKNRCHV